MHPTTYRPAGPPARHRRLSATTAGAGIVGAGIAWPLAGLTLDLSRLALDGVAARWATLGAVMAALLPILWRAARWGADV